MSLRSEPGQFEIPFPEPVRAGGLARLGKGSRVYRVTDVIDQRTTTGLIVRVAFLDRAIGRHELGARRRHGWEPVSRLDPVADPF